MVSGLEVSHVIVEHGINTIKSFFFFGGGGGEEERKRKLGEYFLLFL